MSDREYLWAAALYGGRDARITGDAALVALGIKTIKVKAVDLAVPHGRKVVSQEPKRRLPVTVRRVTGLHGWGYELRGLPVLQAHIAALHAASFADTDATAEARIAAAVQQRITAVPLLRKGLQDLPCLTRRALVLNVLDDVERGAHAGSELQFLAFCRAHGVPLPDELQLKVRSGAATHYLDARYVRQRVTVEMDGSQHRGADTWNADHLRSLRVVAALPGEQVLRLTPTLLRHHAAEVAALLRQILM